MAVDEKHSGEGARSSDHSVVQKLLVKTSVFGLRRYVVVGICVGCLILTVVLFILCARNRIKRKRRMLVKQSSGLVPMTLKDITELTDSDRTENGEIVDTEENDKDEKGFGSANACKVIDVEVRSVESNLNGDSLASSSSLAVGASIGWGRWYTLRELEIATGGFSDENVIGEGGYGVVYRGILADRSLVAVKNIFNNKGQAEKEFKVEVEAIGKVRHKNLVGLIGYCAEGAHRMLVFEYVDNGNLEQWLHGDVGPSSPLTWDIRMKIAIGTAKGLAYLHEGLEPKVVHRDVKSSNILLDKKWNPKVSDFGLAKLLGSDAGYVTTRIMGTFGYVAPEYASSGKLNEGNDVYSFGVLLMEIISGRGPIDHARPAGEVNLVDWFKRMIGSQRSEELVDPLIEVKPSLRDLKRILLVCLRCIDLDTNKRPKMGQVVHMLEADEFPFRTENMSRCKAVPHTPMDLRLHLGQLREAKLVTKDGDLAEVK